MLTVQILSWGMVIASSMRYTLSTSMEANEVIGLSMDNIWRSTQLFYMTAPLLLYSIIKGTQDYIRTTSGTSSTVKTSASGSVEIVV